MARRTKTIIAILISVSLMLAMSGCGSKSDPEKEPAPDIQTEDQDATDEASDDYDIAANLKLMGDPEGVKIVDTDHFTLTLPLGGSWDYDYDSKTSITFYNIAGREAGCGGRLFSLVAFEPDDTSYENLPHFSVVGEAGGKVYVAEYPSDVQADIEVEEHMEQYQTVYAEVSKIESKAADSPLVLK